MSAIFDIELQDAGLPHRDESEDDDVIEIDAVIKTVPPRAPCPGRESR